jgi:muramidase (phage lysozyme)
VLSTLSPLVFVTAPPSKPGSSPNSSSSDQPQADHGPLFLTSLMFLGVTWLLLKRAPVQFPISFGLPIWGQRLTADASGTPFPLAMQGGDPYLRALMRTISASESNGAEPYRLLYGGELIRDLSHHPKKCVPIVTGPNRGNCTTAAGRYQFIDTTWQAKAQRYHPRPPVWYSFWQGYSFAPQYQDEVVYRWLADPQAWGTDIAQLLRQGQIKTVLQLLSGTWTSLGYGIESNSMSAHLPDIYQKLLAEELANRP